MANELAIPGLKLPAMPTVEMFAPMLQVRYYDSGHVNWDVYVSPRRHIPREQCNAILAELEAANVPAPKPVAARLAKLLIGSYPAREMSDPEVFVSVVTHTLASYPPDIGLQAVDDLTRTSRWLPTRADIVDACDKRVTERAYAAHVVQKHLEAHDENDRRREAERQRLARRAEHYGEQPWLRLVDHYGLLIPVLRHNPEMDGTVQRLCEEFGTNQVEAWLTEIRDGPADQVPTDWIAFERVLLPRRQAARQAPPPARSSSHDPGGRSKSPAVTAARTAGAITRRFF